MPAQLAERKRRGEELGLLQDTGHKGGNKVIGNVKRKRHRFKSFKEQVKEVDIDVYKSLVPRRDAPLEGSTSFFQEKLIEWRELNAAHDWLECYKELQPLCSTLAQLVHYQHDILQALLGRLSMQCQLSLEPILDLISTLSRDLASDFLEHLEKVFVAVVDVVVVQGGHNNAQVLQYVYTSMSAICKNLAKYLVLDLKPILKLTVDLRHHASQHVRKFTAEALGFLIRRARDEQAEDAIHYLYAEAVEVQNEFACNGNGEMVASAIKGVGNGLHSRCDRLLNMLFDDELAPSGEMAARAVVYSIRHFCLVSCFEHVRESERLNPIWNVVIRYCLDLSGPLRQQDSMSSSILEENARMMKLMGVLVRHRGGSRVVDHIDDIFTLLDSFLQSQVSGIQTTMLEGDAIGNKALESEYACPDFETNLLNFLAIFLRITAKTKHDFEDLCRHVASWRKMLEQVDEEKYLNFVTSLFQSPKHHLQKNTEKSKYSNIPMIFIPLAIEKIVASNRNKESLMSHMIMLGDYIWELDLMEDIAMYKNAMRLFIQKAMMSKNVHLVWAAIKITKILCESWYEADEFYSNALKACIDLQHSLGLNEYLALQSSVFESKSRLVSYYLQRGPVDGIDEFADTVLAAVMGNPTNYFCIKAASILVTNMPCQMSMDKKTIQQVSQNLSSSCRNLRIHSLQLVISSQESQAENPLSYLLELETRPLGADSGRHAVVTLGRIQNLIEYRKVPDELVGPTVRGLFGLMHIKLSSYWGPAGKALAAAVNAFPKISWPITLEKLVETQSELYKHGMNTQFLSSSDNTSADASPLCRQFAEYLCEANPDSYSDAAARLSHQLKAISEVNTDILAENSKQWVPVFLAFANDVDILVEEDDDTIDPEKSRRHIPPRVWRSLLRDWFKVLLSFKSLNQIADSTLVLEAVSSHLMDLDPLVQKTVFNVLKLFKLKWLNPYLERILRLIDNKTLRSELTSFPLAPDATSVRNEDSVLRIETEHRKDLVPFIIASLFPRMRKRNGRLGGKGAPGSARVAILNFLAGAEPIELNALLELFLLPLSPCFIRLDEKNSPKKHLYLSSCDADLWWGENLYKKSGGYWMKHIDVQMLEHQPIKRHIGYLNAIDDLIKHLGFKLVDYLPVICTLIVKMLQLATIQGSKESKEVRIKCLRLISVIFQTFPTQIDYDFLWDIFFSTIERFISQIPIECNADRPPALLEICKSLSEDQSLALVLSKQANLLEKSISVLIEDHCSESSRSSVLDILENMFDHKDSDVIGCMIDWPFAHTDVILAGLDNVLRDFRKHRMSSIRSLQILEKISADTNNTDTALKLSSALLNLLVIPKRKWQTEGKRKIDEELTSRACLTISALWNKMHEKSFDQESSLIRVPPLLAPLVLVLKTQEARQSLSAALESLALILPDISQCASLFSGMNAYLMNEYDYDRRLDSYSSLNRDCWQNLLTNRCPCSSLIMYQCCVDLSNSSDISLRHSAARALENLLSAVVSLMTKEARDGSIQMIKRVLMPEIRRKLTSPSLTIRQEHLEFIRKVSLALPDYYPELQAVTHKDDDIDFWMNVCHVQLHRRARAFARLEKIASSLETNLLRGYILVLIERTIIEGVEGKTEAKHDTKQSDVDKGANVTDSAINLLAKLAQNMEWNDLNYTLTRYLDLVKLHADDACIKSVIRASSLVLDTVSSKSVDLRDNEEFIKLVTTRVIPNLKEKMVEGETVRTPVAMALVKVLKLLPETNVRSELPRILQIVCNLLRMRLQRIRDDARSILAAMAKELGPLYLVFIIQVLKTSLPLRGFTAHVLGYTFHEILKSVAQEAKLNPGCLDCCIDQIIPIIEGDLFTDIADAKEASEFASSYKESKRCKANDSFLILCSLVKLEDSLPKLLDIVWEKIPMASNSPKLRSKLSLLLQYASKGIIDNPSTSFENMSDMLFGVTEIAKANSNNHSYMMTEFAIVTYYNCLKKKCFEFDVKDQERSSMVICSLFDILKNSKSSGAVSSALQLLYYVLDTQKRSQYIEKDMQKIDITKTIIAILKRCSSTLHPIAQESFGVLAKLIEQKETKATHMQFLLTWAFSELGSSSEKQGAFILLKAIVRKKIILPEVYDVMKSVQELMIKSQHSVVRQLCSTIMLSFLLDYPLGNKRLEHHLQFLLSNMAYEHETGREASIMLIEAIIRKFPDNVLNHWSDKFFVFFITRIVNESSRKLREKIVEMILLLLSRVSYETRKRFLISYCLDKWLDPSSPNARTIISAILVIVVQILENKSKVRMEQDLLHQFFDVSVPKVVNMLDKDDLDPLFTHKCVLFIEGCYKSNPEHVGEILKHNEFFSSMKLAVHSHTWVRKAAGRLIGLALQHEHINNVEGIHSLFVQQLEELLTDDTEADALAAQSVKNLVFILPTLDETALQEVVQRMIKLADSTSYAKKTQRNYALRFIAASVVRLGPERSQNVLPLLLRPIFRITDSGSESDLKDLAQEIFAHVKKVVGPDAAITAYNKAREDVSGIRLSRKVDKKLLEVNEPEKAAALKIKKNLRKKIGKKKKMNELRRLRDAGHIVKNTNHRRG